MSENGEKEGAANDGSVVDFRGNPVDKSRSGGWLAAGLILGNLIWWKMSKLSFPKTMVCILTSFKFLDSLCCSNRAL